LEILQDLRELGVPDASLLDYLIEDWLSGDDALAAMEAAEEAVGSVERIPSAVIRCDPL
jgi:hypothetical protein